MGNNHLPEPLAKLPQLDEPSAFLASVERSC
jgi:hypothetical protein